MKKFKISVLLKGKEAYCNGLYDLESNNLKVLAGSKIRKSWSPNFKYFNKRNTQILNDKYEDTNEQKESIEAQITAWISQFGDENTLLQQSSVWGMKLMDKYIGEQQIMLS